MKKIKISKKLSLNKENILALNPKELENAKAGKLPKTANIVCGETVGCVCTGSVVETCGYYCPTIVEH